MKMGAIHLALVVLGLLAMAQQSMQLSLSDPEDNIVRSINDNAGPFFAFVSSSASVQTALFQSGYYTPDKYLPYFDHAGRRFYIGTIMGASVICVISGSRSVNAAITTQALLDIFRIRGIIHLGRAGTVDDALNIGDVSIPGKVAFTSVWRWLPHGAKNASLQFGDYNSPVPGDNLLGTVATDTVELYGPNTTVSKIFWIKTDAKWLKIAYNLVGLRLEKCISSSNCLAKSPEVDVGSRGSSSDFYIANAAYRGFVRRRFHASIVDKESAAIALTAMTNRKPFIIIRGVTSTAGGSKALSSFSSLGRANAVTTAVRFITYVNERETYDS